MLPSSLEKVTRLALNQPSLRTVLTGFHLAWEGSKRAVCSRHISSLYATLFGLLAFSLVLYLATKLIMYIASGLWIALWLLLPINRSLFEGLKTLSEATNSLTRTILDFLPNLILFTLRYLYPEPIESLFFNSIIETASDVAFKTDPKAIYCVKFSKSQLLDIETGRAARRCGCFCYRNPRGAAIHRLFLYLARVGKRIVLLAFISLVSLLPVVGRFAWPLATVHYIYSTLGMKTAIYFSFGSLLFPSLTGFLSGRPLSFLLKLRLFARELLEPYLSRSNLKQDERRHFIQQNTLLLCGFSLFFYLPMQIPIVGPFVFGFAEAAISVLFLQVVETR